MTVSEASSPSCLRPTHRRPNAMTLRKASSRLVFLATVKLPAEVDEIRVNLVNLLLAEQVVPARHAARLQRAVAHDLLEGGVCCGRRSDAGPAPGRGRHWCGSVRSSRRTVCGPPRCPPSCPCAPAARSSLAEAAAGSGCGTAPPPRRSATMRLALPLREAMLSGIHELQPPPPLPARMATYCTPFNRVGHRRSDHRSCRS